MAQATYIVFLIVNIFYNTASCLDSFYAVRTNKNPKPSCHEIANIETARRCLGICRTKKDKIVMISFDKSSKTCMCCSDLTGSDITGQNWKSYVPRTCKYFINLIKVFISMSPEKRQCLILGFFSVNVDNRRRRLIVCG